MKFFYRFLGSVAGILVLVASILAYYVKSIDTELGVVYDGLGRVLYEPPWWVRLFITEEPVWAGVGWHLFDIVWFFGGIAIAIWLFNKGES
jgi:hypothetical protein